MDSLVSHAVIIFNHRVIGTGDGTIGKPHIVSP
jgi:hypothetical protein